MASSGSVDDDSFRERVKKTFGSLSFTQSSSPSSNPPWSLTGEEIEKREWRRDQVSRARESNPCSASLDELFSRNNKSQKSPGSPGEELDEAPEEEGNRSGADEWGIRSSIGLDNTLDEEEEEDMNDIVASGRDDNNDDRLYMRDVKESHPKPDNPGRPIASVIARRDPRANHFAARNRLIEDDTAAAATTPTGEKKNDVEQHSTDSATPDKEADNTGTSSTSNIIIKPILKRKGADKDPSKPAKRVRFDPSCKFDEYPNMDEEPSGVTSIHGVEMTTTETGSMESSDRENNTTVFALPDYLLNPSKYTRYSLDSTYATDDKPDSDSDLSGGVVKANGESEGESRLRDEGVNADACRSVVFIPKKRSNASSELANQDGDGGTSASKEGGNDVTRTSCCLLSVGQLEQQEEGIAPGMEVDEPEEGKIRDKHTTVKKPGRHYRSRPGLDDECSSS